MAEFKLTKSQLLTEKKTIYKKHLKAIAFTIALETTGGHFHGKMKHNTPEKFAELYGYELPLVKTCIKELKTAGELE